MNCKPGDLALCVAGEHAGAVCEVIGQGQVFVHQSTLTPTPGWIVAFPRPMPWGEMTQPHDACEGWYPDAWLKPINPGEKAATVEREHAI